jgi:hypothetical protein
VQISQKLQNVISFGTVYSIFSLNYLEGPLFHLVCGKTKINFKRLIHDKLTTKTDYAALLRLFKAFDNNFRYLTVITYYLYVNVGTNYYYHNLLYSRRIQLSHSNVINVFYYLSTMDLKF